MSGKPFCRAMEANRPDTSTLIYFRQLPPCSIILVMSWTVDVLWKPSLGRPRLHQVDVPLRLRSLQYHS